MWASLPTIWKECFKLAWDSFCMDSVPIGSVIADENNRIIAYGRNGESGIENKKIAHAEMNALIKLGSLDYKEFHKYCLYSSFEPCPMCFGTLYMSGIRNLTFACNDAYAGSTNIYQKTPFLSKKKINIIKYNNYEFSFVNMVLNVEFEKRHRSLKKIGLILDEWNKEYKKEVDLGLHIYYNKLLLDYSKNNSQADLIYDFILSMIIEN